MVQSSRNLNYKEKDVEVILSLCTLKVEQKGKGGDMIMMCKYVTDVEETDKSDYITPTNSKHEATAINF